MCANSFTSIGTTALVILNRLQCKLRVQELNEQRDDIAGEQKQPADTADKEKNEAHRRFVARRIADLAAFERRARGEKD